MLFRSLHDLQDFALGFGWLAVVLLAFLFTERTEPRRMLLAMICVAQPIVVAATGLMQTETARTWCFMLPLVAVPVGLELSRWPVRARWIVYAAMWLILCLIGQNMIFIFNPGTRQSVFAQ